MKFARLFELEDQQQVLLKSEYNEKDKSFILKLSTYIKGVTTSTDFSFSSEEESIIAMNKFTLEQAIKFRRSLVGVFTGIDKVSKHGTKKDKEELVKILRKRTKGSNIRVKNKVGKITKLKI